MRYDPHVAKLPPACGEQPADYRAEPRRARRPGERPARPEAEATFLRSDALALSIKAARDRLALSLAREAAAFVQAGAWSEHGYARLEDHARERFGRSGRWLRDLAALGRTLETLPGLGAALTGSDGGRPVGRVAALLIGRVASAESVAAWVRLARAVTVRELRAAARRARACGSDRPPEEAECPGAGRSGEAERTGAGAERDAAVLDPALADPPCLVRIAVPEPVSAAFDETLDLYRAVVGSEATVTSFIEALVGEARSDPRWEALEEMGGTPGADAGAASPFPPLPVGVQAPPLSRGLPAGRREAIWARATSRWSRLPVQADAQWAAALAEVDLEALHEGCGAAGDGAAADGAARNGAPRDGNADDGAAEAARLDAAIRRLISLEDRLERLLGRVLAQMSGLGAWVRLGFAGLGHYAEERLGMCRSTACERAAAARQAPRLPVLFRAYQQGEIGLDAALRIARLLRGRQVDCATVQAWVARAREATAKRLKDEVRALGRAGVVSRRTTGGDAPPRPLDDATWHRSLRRKAGRSRGWVETFGVAALVRPKPDVFLSLRLPADLAGDLLETIGSECRRLATMGAGPAVVGSDAEATAGRGAHAGGPHLGEADEDGAGPPPSERIARRMAGHGRALPGWVGLLSLLEGFVATWDPVPGAAPRRRSEEVYERDGWRCSAPGCTSRRNLEDHHMLYRSRGGSNALWNRVCACGFHHRLGEHGGLARCRGVAPLGVTWRLGRAGLTSALYRNEIRLPDTERAEGRSLPD